MRALLNERPMLLVALAGLAIVTGAAAAPSAGTVHAVTSTALGTRILVNARGFTLYHWTKEKKGAVACTGACRKSWPPLLAGTAKPVAGPGASAARLGTVKRPDGGVQVTYNGYPLYLYSGDRKAGQANGQGASNAWYALTPAGAVTKAAVHTSTTPSKSGGNGSTTAPTSSGGGGGTTTIDSSGCPAGTTMEQGPGPNSDDDDDNEGGPDDGDGCL
jgi:predicted lipoprotein with Yx(FWY)xxD motif